MRSPPASATIDALPSTSRRRARAAGMATTSPRPDQRRSKSLPPKYFYDAAGSRCSKRSPRLPEYYLTRAEERLLDDLAADAHARPGPARSSSSARASRTRRGALLDARGGAALRYTPVDVDETALARRRPAPARRPTPSSRSTRSSATSSVISSTCPGRRGRRLVLFLGSTIGNLDAPARHALLRADPPSAAPRATGCCSAWTS